MSVLNDHNCDFCCNLPEDVVSLSKMFNVEEWCLKYRCACFQLINIFKPVNPVIYYNFVLKEVAIF